MKVKYALQSKTITTYGVKALDKNGKVVKQIDNVFYDKDKAEDFVTLCNSEKVELIHLQNVAEDEAQSFLTI